MYLIPFTVTLQSLTDVGQSPGGQCQCEHRPLLAVPPSTVSSVLDHCFSASPVPMETGAGPDGTLAIRRPQRRDTNSRGARSRVFPGRNTGVMFGPADMPPRLKVTKAARMYIVENFLGKKCSYRGAATAYNTTSLAEIRKTVLDMRANGAAAELQVDA